MQIVTESDFSGIDVSHPWSQEFKVLTYSLGGFSIIPNGFFRDWRDRGAQNSTFFIGRCSGFGVGSLVKYNAGHQVLRVGRFVSGGMRLRFVLNSQHEPSTISTYMFGFSGMGLKHAPPPQYGDSIIKNDVWIGDEVMMLGGGIIENGCIIGARSLVPPNFSSEPYGKYVGSPARLVSFRFSEKVRGALLDLAWWEMPLSWIRDNNDGFLADLTADEGKSLELIAELKLQKQHKIDMKNDTTLSLQLKEFL